MATATAPLQGTSWFRPKYLLFGFIGLMLAYVLNHNESFLIHSDAPIWQHYHVVGWYLLPHGIAGACALFLAPMQFSDRLRQRYTKLHRVVGRIYVGGVLFAAPLGIVVQYLNESRGDPRSFSVAAAVQASSWILTTAIAMAFILRGRVEQHRRWMTRSFAVALVFLEVRVIGGVTGWEQLGAPAIETIVWVCNVFTLLAADIALQVQESFRARPARSAAIAAGD